MLVGGLKGQKLVHIHYEILALVTNLVALVVVTV